VLYLQGLLRTGSMYKGFNDLCTAKTAHNSRGLQVLRYPPTSSDISLPKHCSPPIVSRPRRSCRCRAWCARGWSVDSAARGRRFLLSATCTAPFIDTPPVPHAGSLRGAFVTSFTASRWSRRRLTGTAGLVGNVICSFLHGHSFWENR
jgi:hypothetical protein